MTVVDIHPHVIASDTRRYPLAPLGGKQSDWSRTRPVTLEQLVAAMDATAIDKAAIVQASTCYGHDNSYVADAVAAYPKRFTGVFSVDVLAPDASQRMRDWYAKGLTGMRLFTFGSTMSEQADWLDDPKSYLAWGCANDLGLSICLQMSAKAIPQAVHGRGVGVDVHAPTHVDDEAAQVVDAVDVVGMRVREEHAVDRCDAGLDRLLAPDNTGPMTARPVGRAVGSARNYGPELIEPLSESARERTPEQRALAPWPPGSNGGR